MRLDLTDKQLYAVKRALRFSATANFDAAINYMGKNDDLVDFHLKIQQEYDDILNVICQQEQQEQNNRKKRNRKNKCWLEGMTEILPNR